MIIWKRASRPEGEAFVTCEFVWSLVQICSGRSPGRTIQHLPVFLCLRLQTIIIIFVKKSELAHENYTMKSVIYSSRILQYLLLGILLGTTAMFITSFSLLQLSIHGPSLSGTAE